MAGPQALHSEVSRAVEEFRNAGQIPTVELVQAALGGSHSRLRILRLMAEVIAAEAALCECTGKAEGSPKALQLALTKENWVEPKTLEESTNELVSEAEATLGCSWKVFERIDQLEAEKSRLTSELKACRARLMESSSSNPRQTQGESGAIPKEIFGL